MKSVYAVTLAVIATASIASASAQEFQGKVLSVQGADSFTASVYGRAWRVRLADVVATGNKTGAAELRKLVGGKTVNINVVGTDSDGRIIGKVESGGVDVAAALLGSGAVAQGNPLSAPSYVAEKPRSVAVASAKPVAKKAAAPAEKRTSGSGNIDEEEIRAYLNKTPDLAALKFQNQR